MRFSPVVFAALCASFAIADVTNDTTCVGSCLKDIATSVTQAKGLLNCTNVSNTTEELQCFCESDNLIKPLSGCVQANCANSAFGLLQKACAKAGVQLPDAPKNAAFAVESASFVLLVTTGLAVMSLM